MTALNTITIEGARQHNLKDISLCLPRNQLVVITGLSGSGKSTLAFDTLYAEGQRRYVESLSTYARQFLERLEKPDVDLIEGLSPAIAIEQKTASHNPRSTVGTVTEIYDFIRLLYARTGVAHCYRCGRPILSQSIDEMVTAVMQRPEGARLLVLAPLHHDPSSGHKGLFKRLRKEGFARIRMDGKIYDLESLGDAAGIHPKQIDVVVDRLILKSTIRNRLADSMELAIGRSEGQVAVAFVGERMDSVEETLRFSETAACLRCGISYPELSPSSFSFNSPHGACPHCDGLGIVRAFSPARIVPNPELSLREGAVAVWAQRHSVAFAEFLEDLTTFYGVDIYTPYQDLPDHFRSVLMHGSGDQKIPFGSAGHATKTPKPFEGILAQLSRQYAEAGSTAEKNTLAEYMAEDACPHCHGSRLRRESRQIKIDGIPIFKLTARSISDLLRFFKAHHPDGKRRLIAEKIVKEIVARLAFLEDVGLGYLTLDRPAHTLSGGESQRIRLATQIGAKLTGVLYVLDEPSIGLHQRDNSRLLGTLTRMRDMGNSVLVVEHDEETILAADHVVDMGPGAGMKGGHVVFQGTPAQLLGDAHSLTGRYLSGRLRIDLPERRRPADQGSIRITGACQNNLKNIDVTFPLGVLTCVTGVSGSGKSTLVIETLYRAARRRLQQLNLSAGHFGAIAGLERVDKIIDIDQSPIGKTPRSNPGTYTGLLSPIRDLFSRTPEARMRGYKPGRFSFNMRGGRCEACGGDGIIRIEMHFLPDVYVPCDVCRGKRYNRETLEIRYKGRNIAEVLAMTVNQGLAMFQNVEAIRTKLQTLADVGLGYVPIGQSATTLSGGEAQRIKLARELSRRSTGNTLYILDEPTTGLHPDDIRKLLGVLGRLVDAGNTVVIIEHNLDVIKTADHVIDLGPEGGDGGGFIVAAGTPEDICQVEDSHTGRYLKKVLGNRMPS
ncbi:excinuclease ABC subunit UvrA [Desulfosarcina ovata]|uniref:UvrABC system protein A n=1 Tax=Desulfosarcina ovata subsp. ovata TaxID=2752305 RepID=A0A5K8ALR1_9BACT|nr:excinuclease ABC subunit UvrA [Desulfosarcina ovata]BBO93509.1 UvrABC system protein A [Desulfosarcina ovata subsp. ovata]